MNRALRFLLLQSEDAFSPLSLSPALWLKADAGLYQERTGASATTPASADADPVGSYLDQSGNANHATAASDSVRPALKLNIANGLPMILPDAVDDVMALTSALSFTGVFTVYAVGTRANLTSWFPLGQTSTTGGQFSQLVILSDNKAYCTSAAGVSVSQNYTGSAGTIIARWRRDASNVVKFTATGMAEVTLGTLAGTLTLPKIFANPTNFNGGTNKHGELVAKAADVLTDSPALDALMVTYLQNRWGVTLP